MWLIFVYVYVCLSVLVYVSVLYESLCVSVYTHAQAHTRVFSGCIFGLSNTNLAHVS